MNDEQKILLAVLAMLGISALVAKRAIDDLLPSFKAGVITDGLEPVMDKALAAVSLAAQKTQAPNIVTSALDGKHMDGSLHPVGKAIDARRVDWPKFDNIPLATEQANLIRGLLPGDFDVVLESTHVHIEFDPKVA